jgi:isonocardicin synthase
VLPDGRTVRAVRLHLDARTGDIDLDIEDEVNPSKKSVEEENRVGVILARRQAFVSAIRSARSDFAEGNWQGGLAKLQTVVDSPYLPLDDEFQESVGRMHAEVLRYIGRVVLDEIPQVETCIPVELRRPVEVREAHWHGPQNFFLVKGAGRTLVGRRLLSRGWIQGDLSELFCAQLRPEMLLGEWLSHRSLENEVVVYYRPLSRAECQLEFLQLANSSTTELVFPFVYLTRMGRNEVTSPVEGWTVDEVLREQLFRGEELHRNYAIKALRGMITKGCVLYDPACSTGDFLASIQQAFPGTVSIGQDLSAAMTNMAATRLNQVYTGDAISAPIPPESVDVLFLRFLNSEVVSGAYAIELFEAILQRVKRGGIVVVFGHTPTLVDSALFESRGLEVLGRIGVVDSSIFQFYVLKRP